MTASDHTRAADGLLFASELTRGFGTDLRPRGLIRAGRLYRVARGQYIDATAWANLTADDRYVVRVAGAARARSASMVVSHQSAAALWGLPLLDGRTADVHFTIERASGGRSDPGIRKHAVGIDAEDVVTLDGLLVTSIARTVVDIAATLDLTAAVVVADRALHLDRFGHEAPLATREELFGVIERSLPLRGSVRARAVIAFGTHLSGSPGESASRVNIALNGFPEPVLQQTFTIDGREYDTDFYWREQDAIGESDGRGKYFEARYRRGRSPEDVHFAEKTREDALRRKVRAFTRWDFQTGMSQQRLRRRLLELDLPVGRPRLLRH
ncbi:hypothetical protein [Marisediminicola antarctica]|uniref:Transcriptional regulator, AbiEi antitoxin, Type IV TA system n=1 Tax=Marisediminicola antarctica TaxID=674079 RepID=A0A7L5AGY9_9MICO|nr:hypothetical protein [Marisediminicola antarctica]QHO69035.1 hypothetical protein BHD05_04635 [Marisediminicola antarctica]